MNKKNNTKTNEEMTNVELINSYAEKIDKNIRLCRIRNIVYSALIFIIYIYVSIDGYNYTVNCLIWLVIFAYFPWWISTYYLRNANIEKMRLCSLDNSYMKCPKCGKYKLVNKSCDICGNNIRVSDDDLVKLINEVDSNRKKNITIGFLVCILLFLLVISFTSSGPSKPLSDDLKGNILFVFVYGSFLLSSLALSIIFPGLVLLVILNVRSKNKFCNLEINMLSNSNIIKCENCDTYIRKNNKSHRCNIENE